MDGKLPAISGKKFSEFFKSKGYVFTGQKGSHMKMSKTGYSPVIIPDHKEVSVGVILTSLRRAKISREEFIRAMRGGK